jgi:hypothetical protein
MTRDVPGADAQPQQRPDQPPHAQPHGTVRQPSPRGHARFYLPYRIPCLPLVWLPLPGMEQAPTVIPSRLPSLSPTAPSRAPSLSPTSPSVAPSLVSQWPRRPLRHVT